MSQWKKCINHHSWKTEFISSTMWKDKNNTSSCPMTYTHILRPPHIHTQTINVSKWIVTFIDVCLRECIQLFVCISSEANGIIRLSAVWVTGNLKMFLETKLLSSAITRNVLNCITISSAMITIFEYVVTVLMKHPNKVFE